MWRKAYYGLLRWSEEGWRSLKTGYFRVYDGLRDFIIAIDEETRPDRPRRGSASNTPNAAPKPPRHAAVPAGTRVYAIGDIHGRADLLAGLMEKIEADAGKAQEEKKILVFLGDYVDRGFQSREVIEYLISADLSQFETYFLKGNHESAFEMFLSDPEFGPEWARFGGAETLMSYGIQPPRSKTQSDAWRTVCDELNQNLPVEHRKFLNSLGHYLRIGDYIFVHAGLRPGTPLEQQTERDMLWIRQEFLEDEEEFECVVVHGHTPISQPHLDRRRIGIDTGAYLTGKLTAACFTGTDVSFLST